MSSQRALDRSALGGFAHERVLHALEFVDDDLRTVRNLAKFDLAATRDERFFRRKYTWSGSGIEKPPQVLSGRDNLGHAHHRLHGPIIREGVERVYLVDLGREFRKGEQVSLVLQQTFIDVDGTLEPFLACMAREGSKELRLQVSFPAGMHLKVKAQKHPGGSSVPTEAIYIEAEQEKKEGGLRAVYRHREVDPSPGTNFKLTWHRYDEERNSEKGPVEDKS